MFIWKLIFHRLLTSSWMSRIYHSQIPPCHIYNLFHDSIFHIFFTCSYASSFWRLVESKLNFSFKFFNSWERDAWINEGFDLGKDSGIFPCSLIANSLVSVDQSKQPIALRLSFHIAINLVSCSCYVQ